MTGFMSSKFRHDCALRGCYNASLPNWDELLEGVFPRKVWPTDVDGFVELNDHFLFLEQKGEGVSLTTGQRLALFRLSTRARVTVAFFRPGRQSDYEVLIVTDGTTDGFRPCSKDQFKAWLMRWVAQAEGQTSEVVG
jgi:hypothetical protein